MLPSMLGMSSHAWNAKQSADIKSTFNFGVNIKSHLLHSSWLAWAWNSGVHSAELNKVNCDQYLEGGISVSQVKGKKKTGLGIGSSKIQ